MLVIERKPNSMDAEAYRSLRANVEFLALDKKHKVIIITSYLAGEGKSIVAANLAYSLANGHKKVLLLDFNFRNPSIHHKFKLSNSYGMADYFLNGSKFDEVVEEYCENLYIVPSGITYENPADLLNSNKVEEFLTEAKETVDYIIIDTPSLETFVDAQIMAMKADGVILVTDSKNTKREQLAEAIDKINKANGDIIGIVLNDVKRGRNKKRKKRNRRKQANIGEDEGIKEVHPRSYMEV